MEDFLNKLYNYEYFSVYLIVSIIVLVVLFMIILFYGKKDKKKREIEVTKKLQQINEENAFKEENNEEKLEVNSIQEQLENDTIIVPAIEDITNISNNNISIEANPPVVDEIPEPVLPKEEPIKEENNELEHTLPDLDIPMPSGMNFDDKKEKIDSKEVEPIFEKEKEKPFVFEDLTNSFNNVEEVKEEKVEEIKPTPVKEMEVPAFNFEEIVKSVEEPKKEESTFVKGPEIFSSVYVPPKNEEIVEPIVKPIVSSTPVPSKEELDFELPALKKEVKEERKEELEMPVLNDYNLDELSGETYTINR